MLNYAIFISSKNKSNDIKKIFIFINNFININNNHIIHLKGKKNIPKNLYSLKLSNMLSIHFFN